MSAPGFRADGAFAPRLRGVVALGGEYTGPNAVKRNPGHPATGGRTVQVIPASRDFVDLAPEGALLYAPRDDLTLHIRAATGYGTPQVTERMSAFMR